MGVKFEVRLRVPFHDLDPMRIVWHGNYFKYFDMARFGLFKAAGIDLYAYMMEKQYAFPITKTSVKHIIPLRPDEEFICTATVTEARYKIAMEFEIRNPENGQLYTRCKSEQLAVKMPEMELEFEIPDQIRTALGFR